jgi:signal peptidase I
MLAPAAVWAAAPADAEVPFAQALADARQIANLNTGWQVYLSRGESMLPQIDQGSLLLADKADFAHLTPGMLVVYRDHDGDLVSHRLIAWTRNGWIAKGLNNDRPDPGLVTRGNLQGVVFGIMRYQTGTEVRTAMSPAPWPAVAYAKKYEQK